MYNEIINYLYFKSIFDKDILKIINGYDNLYKNNLNVN